MMRGHLNMVEFTQRRQLATFGKSTRHGTIELENLNGLFFKKRSTAVTGLLALSGG